jgi:glucose dehydrogenase
MAPIAAGGESCRHVGSDPTIDIESAMRGTDARTTLRLTALFSVVALTLVPQSAFSAGEVDPSRLKAADSEPQNWFTLGRDQNLSYYSPLAKINAGNVSRLGFAST